jgi:hypothetical protein
MSKKESFNLGVGLMVLGGSAFVLPMLGLQWEIFDVFGIGWTAVAAISFLSGTLMAINNYEG